MQLQKSQKIKFTFQFNFQSNMTIDMSCFCISKEGKLVGDRYMVFYRENGEWMMHAIGEPGNGSTQNELLPLAMRHF